MDKRDKGWLIWLAVFVFVIWLIFRNGDELLSWIDTANNLFFKK